MHFCVLLPATTALLSLFASASAGAISDPESTFGELNILNGTQREEAYHRLSVASQHAFWVGKLSSYKAKHLDELNEDQLQALDTAISSVTSTLTTEGEDQLKTAMMEAFGDEKATTLLASLDSGDEDNSDDNDTLGVRGETKGVCPCAVDSSYCGVFNCKASQTCKVEQGCGTYWQHYCNGRCRAKG